MSNAAAVESPILAGPRFNVYDEPISSTGATKPIFHFNKHGGVGPAGLKASGVGPAVLKAGGVAPAGPAGLKPSVAGPAGLKPSGAGKNGASGPKPTPNGVKVNGLKPGGASAVAAARSDGNNNHYAGAKASNTSGGVRFGLFKVEHTAAAAAANKIPVIEADGEPIVDEPASSSIDHRNYDHLVRLAGVVRQLAHLTETPRVGIICGSGLGAMADQIRDAKVVPFADIPGFPRTSVVGHKGNLVFGWLDGTYVMCLQGRFHPYEHNMDLSLCSMPVRIMHFLGVETLIVSNAAGGMNAAFRSGDLMIIKDHISMPALVGFGPLVGLNDARFGPRFVSVHDAYDKELRSLGAAVAGELRIGVHEGVYVMNGGPQYESPAEIRFLKAVGGDAVGMSTCHEVIVARQCGIRVFGFSLITNVCNTSVDSAVEVSHEEVIQSGREASERACKFVAALVERLRGAHLAEPRMPRVDSWQIS